MPAIIAAKTMTNIFFQSILDFINSPAPKARNSFSKDNAEIIFNLDCKVNNNLLC